jgi:hypothetical protein
MEVSFGPQVKKCQFDTCIFRWPRGGCKVFVSLTAVYEALQLTQYEGTPSRWIYNGRKKWQKQLNLCGLEHGLQSSDQVGKARKGDSSLAGDLPFNAASPCGLLLLLDRFCLRSERFCGLMKDRDRLNARWLLESLLHTVAKSLAGKYIVVSISRTWHDIFPRPRQYDHPVRLEIDEVGYVSVAGWRALAEQGGAGSFAASSWALVSEDLPVQCSILDLMNVLGEPGSPSLHGIFSQLISELGSTLHSIIVRLSNEGGTMESLSLKKVEIKDVLVSRGHMDNMLFRYTETCKLKTRGQQYWTSCSDKSAVGGFSMQVTLFAFSNNVGIVPPPAFAGQRVARVCRNSSVGEGSAHKEFPPEKFGAYAHGGSVSPHTCAHQVCTDPCFQVFWHSN